MTTDAPPPPRSVLLIAGCFADAAPALDLAVAVARRMGAGLEGVLALDPRAEGAALATVGARGRAGPAPGGEGLRRACAADARAFRRRLDLAAAGASLRWQFRTQSGVLPDLALVAGQPGDIVILGHRRFLALRGPVVALDDRASGPLSRFAADLARVLGLSARILPADTPPATIDLMAASALLLPRGQRTDARWLSGMIDAARCPVLLNLPEGPEADRPGG